MLLTNCCLWSAGRPAAHVVRAFPRQDQQLALPGGMMHPGTADQCGEDCRSFTLNWREGQREGGGGWGGALTVRPSLVHTFRRSYVEQNKRTPLKDTGVWITTPRLDSSLVPASAASRLRFLFPVDFLFISAHPAYAVFVLQPTPPSFLFFSVSPPPL